MYEKKNYQQIVDTILDHIVRGHSEEKFVFLKSERLYPLSSLPKNKIPFDFEISGYHQSKFQIFEFKRDFDYDSDQNSIFWIESDNSLKPDEKSIFILSYFFEKTSGLSDTNPGSILRTLVEGISKELELLYQDMDGIYESGFIETASGRSLDMVVSLLGIVRKPSTKSSGQVTFSRLTPPEEVQTEDVYIYEKSNTKASFTLKNKNIARIISVEGKSDNKKHKFEIEVDYVLDDNSNIVFNQSDYSKVPDFGSEIIIKYSFYKPVFIPKNTVVSTGPQPNNNKTIKFVTLHDVFIERIVDASGEELWEATVDVESEQPGYDNNVNSGMVTIMTKPPVGVEKVINRMRISGALGVESDESLRNRAKKILDEKGKATVDSLRTALESIEGVRLEPVIVDMYEGVIGIVKIIVDGGSEDEIKRTIERTKAAGIRVEFERPVPVYADIDITVILEKDVIDKPLLVQKIQDTIKDFVSQKSIGETIIINQIISIILSDPNIYDIKKLDIVLSKETNNGKDKTSRNFESIVLTKGENIQLLFNEILVIKNINITIKNVIRNDK